MGHLSVGSLRVGHVPKEKRPAKRALWGTRRRPGERSSGGPAERGIGDPGDPLVRGSLAPGGPLRGGSEIRVAGSSCRASRWEIPQ
jgi:hypothetical protein